MMKNLLRCLKNDIRGLNIIEDQDLNGFRLACKDTGCTLYTAYVAESGYSSYIAVPDVFKGIDCEDELPLKICSPLFSVVSAIKEHHKRIRPDLYKEIQELYQGAAQELCGFYNHSEGI